MVGGVASGQAKKMDLGGVSTGCSLLAPVAVKPTNPDAQE